MYATRQRTDTMSATFNHVPETVSKCQRSAVHISDHIQGCERMLSTNERLLRQLKAKYNVPSRQIELVDETSAFITREVTDDIENLDVISNRILEMMDKPDGHCALELIPVVKSIKEDCQTLMSRLDEHKRKIDKYRKKIKNVRRVVLKEQSQNEN